MTASVLDVAGGTVAAAGFLARTEDLSDDYLRDRLRKMGTVDLRIDYLLPGRGEEFLATGRIIRSGRTVTVCRMELHNEKGELLASAPELTS